jgi:predicted AAA+ superfamily ATPase
MEPQEWARINKKKIAREFIRKIGYEASESPAAIFTAGLPGAGKTEFTKELLKDISDQALRIDMDEIASLIEGYNPKTADLFRGGASIILDKIYDEVLKAKLDFVMDGTLSHPKALDNINRALDKGYMAKIYFIHQDPVIAWQFTMDRELVNIYDIIPKPLANDQLRDAIVN